ncbi:gliding motility lipoprotein GldD [Ichthyenterobacterium sp. W332]|uniref:Type IV secretion system putative lipoprotein virB7 n=1 Tax=Microcosmobacter mediterraneus TaxID=3075607 RepID=A0ABU2YI08_9FLAO|nr:gliding motility lipoprotein GldD [Ichthyenterobacterium sp. W332]MDT0557793.1 gliding motility lipoprotein GldD [Ichthyenterobacterium sp. W332]
MKKPLIGLLSILILSSCNDEYKPKPNGQLRLDYPEASYKRISPNVPFSFERNTFSKEITSIKIDSKTKTIGLDLEYPQLKGTIYLTYKEVTDDNLITLIKDAQNLTQKHTMKADEIVEQPFINESKRVFGMFYEVGGNAASQSQFYATDSTNHFLNGSLYFYAKPNYDSIYPAAVYLKNDIKQIMESLEWKQ